jgi:AcrR family transcriptional regulator
MAIFLVGMASSESASQPTEPLFPVFDGRLRGLPPERVARHQQIRLQTAMVESVARFGYGGTTLRELVRLAGVSKSTFYDHYESKQDCFLATFETVIAHIAARAGTAYEESGGDFRQRFTAALDAFMEVVVQEPDAARLAVVDSLTLGAAGVAHRERALLAFEKMLRASFEESPAAEPVPTATVRAIAAGIRGVVYRHIRAGTPETLPELVEELVDWALDYQRPEGEIVSRAAAAAAEPHPEAAVGRGGELDWREPPDSQRSRDELTQRQRIVRAVGRLVAENGYETLSIPAISAAAGTSNQTFYEHFGNKRDAFLAAFDLSADEGLYATRRAFEAAGDRPEAIGAGLRAMLEHIAGNQIFARFTFFDLQTAGPVALDRADGAMASFTALLEPGQAPAGLNEVSKTIVDAVGSGCWSVIQYELTRGRSKWLPEKAPELTRIVLTPFVSQ